NQPPSGSNPLMPPAAPASQRGQSKERQTSPGAHSGDCRSWLYGPTPFRWSLAASGFAAASRSAWTLVPQSSKQDRDEKQSCIFFAAAMPSDGDEQRAPCLLPPCWFGSRPLQSRQPLGTSHMPLI